MPTAQEKYYDPNRGRDLRRVNGERKNSFVLTEMYERHHEIARRLLLGQKGTEIAEALNVTPQSVSQVKNSPVVQDKLALMRAVRDTGAIDLATEIANLAPIALGKIKEALEQGFLTSVDAEGKTITKDLTASDILKQANGLLDREIGKPTQTINTRNLHAHYTVDDINRIKEKARSLSGAVTIEVPQNA